MFSTSRQDHSTSVVWLCSAWFVSPQLSETAWLHKCQVVHVCNECLEKCMQNMMATLTARQKSEVGYFHTSMKRNTDRDTNIKRQTDTTITNILPVILLTLQKGLYLKYLAASVWSYCRFWLARTQAEVEAYWRTCTFNYCSLTHSPWYPVLGNCPWLLTPKITFGWIWDWLIITTKLIFLFQNYSLNAFVNICCSVHCHSSFWEHISGVSGAIHLGKGG